jgi:hypothetical protein
MRKTAGQIADMVLIKLSETLCETDPEAAKKRRDINRSKREGRPRRRGILSGGRGLGPGKGQGPGRDDD